jgi:hypothetical protein
LARVLRHDEQAALALERGVALRAAGTVPSDAGMAAWLSPLAHGTDRSYEDVLADLVKRKAGVPARVAKVAKAK